MKNLRTFCVAVVLTFALAASAAAGNMHTGVTNEPSPAPQGTIHTGVAGSSPEADMVAEVTLNLLQSVLSLF